METTSLNGVVGDNAGNVYVIGTVSSTNMPTTVDALQANPGAGQGGEPYDAFIAYVDGNANKIIWATYLGGPRNEEGNGIARDSRGNLYVAGYTQSSGFPITANALQGPRSLANSAFIARIGEQRPPASQLMIVSGNKQQGDQGTNLKDPLVVELRDEFNVPIANQPVTFTATNARLNASTALTNSQGRASVLVTLGDRPGPATVTAASGYCSPLTLRIDFATHRSASARDQRGRHRRRRTEQPAHARPFDKRDRDHFRHAIGRPRDRRTGRSRQFRRGQGADQSRGRLHCRRWRRRAHPGRY
jgi:hypothetical protein